MRRFVVGAALLAVLAGCGALGPFRVPSQPTPNTNWVLDPGTRVRDWQEDIDTLAVELPRRHKNAFFACEREQFDSAVASLRNDVPKLADHEVVVGLMKLAAMLGDAHTGIGTWDVKPRFHSFPAQLYIFRDGPVIIAARESQKDLIGCTLIRFAGVPIEEAFRRVSVASAYENEPTYKSNVARLLTVVEIAHAVGLISSIERVTIDVRDRQGSERSVELTPLAENESIVGPATGDSKLPLSRQTRPHRNWYESLPDHKAVYFRYNTCADEPDLPVSKLGDEVLGAIDAQHAERLILDLRGNGGGNSGLLEPFIRGLKRRKAIDHPGGILVLIGRYTFSSAHMHADQLHKLGATLVGEPTGQKPNAYGEVRWLVLPHSQLTVRYSTRFWHHTPGDPHSLDPDILIEPSSADYLSLKDPVLDAALTYRP